MNSAINVIGMSSLINRNEVDKTINIKDIESEFINKNSYFNKYSQPKEEYVPIDDYQNKLKNINNNISDNYMTLDETKSSMDMDFNDASSFNFDKNFDETRSIISQMNDLDKDLNSLNLNFGGESKQHSNNYSNPPNNYSKPQIDPYLTKMTNEQHNQNIINNALGGDYDENDINFDIDQESKDEKKLMLLEKIEDLKEELVGEGINTEKVPSVDYESDLETIEYVHRVYMIKYNRHRFGGFAEEFILTGAGIIENIFNGQNEFLGLKPDLTDYSSTVRVKLRRLRHETSTIMGGVMEQYDIGPFTRIMIELIPSMFLHAKLNKSQYKNNIYQDVNMNSAISELRSLE